MTLYPAARRFGASALGIEYHTDLVRLALRPDARIVSHEFGLADWAPDVTAMVAERPAHLWVVLARVGGRCSGSMAS